MIIACNRGRTGAFILGMLLLATLLFPGQPLAQAPKPIPKPIPMQPIPIPQEKIRKPTVIKGGPVVEMQKPEAKPLIGLPLLEKVCAIVTCPKPIEMLEIQLFNPPPPTITDVSGEFTPWGLILINGQGFGYVEGTVTLTNLKLENGQAKTDDWIKNHGLSKVDCTGSKCIGEAELHVKEWQDNYILAEILGMGGVCPSQVFVQVKNVGGTAKYLHLYSLSFEPSRWVERAQVTLQYCHDPKGSIDDCKSDDIGFSGQHRFWCCVSGDSGTDEWKISKGQYDVIESYQVNQDPNTGVFGGRIVSVDITGNNDRIRVTWDYDFMSWINYGGSVLVETYADASSCY
jgi:hypothetical protein